jgi:hypothetical protein
MQESLSMHRLPVIVAATLLMTLAAAQAQGPQQGPPDVPKRLLDNERMRVSEMLLKPGAKVELPNRPDQFAYLLTDATLVFSAPGKTPYQLDFKAGEATLLPAQSTEAENESDRDVRAILVEIKQPAARAQASRGKSKARGETTAAKSAASSKAKSGKKRG